MKVIRHQSPKYWILFLLSVVAFFGVYVIAGGYCSMVLPFNITFFALALDLTDRQGKDGSGAPHANPSTGERLRPYR